MNLGRLTHNETLLRRKWIALPLAIILLGGVSTTKAAQIPLSPTLRLSDLIADPANFIVSPSGLATFSDFTFAALTNGNADIDPENIGVFIFESPISGGTATELRFVFGDSTVNGINEFLTMSLGYQIDATLPIFGHELKIVGSAKEPGAGVQVIEALTTPGAETLAVIETHTGPAFVSGDSVVEVVFFDPPQNTIIADKGIRLDTDFFNDGISGEFAVLTTVGQTFFIPEPSSYIMMLIGGLGSCFLLRRMRKANA